MFNVRTLFILLLCLFCLTACRQTTLADLPTVNPGVGATGAPPLVETPAPGNKATAVAATLQAGAEPPVAGSPAGATPPASPIPTPSAAAGPFATRPGEAIILTGADVPALAGSAPGELVAWRYATGWQQIPLQVDERLVVDLRSYTGRANDPPVLVLTYASAALADSDPTLDADDELVFMARDAGAVMPAGAAPPPGVLADAAVVITLSDPLDPAGVGYVYLFRQDGSLDPAGGQDYVSYQFDSDAVDAGGTPEAGSKGGSKQPGGFSSGEATITTAYYRHHFAGRWIMDSLYLFTGSLPDQDLIDRFRVQLAPNDCDRSENTFTSGSGYFLANVDGPVRAIRSYFGANSGIYTQRTHLFYDQRQEVVTALRVHALKGIVDFVDYSPAAIGMRYFNDLNPAGVVIDGLPDDIQPGEIGWELTSGDPGSLVMVYRLASDMPIANRTSYYEDNAAPAGQPCTGDEQVLGASGPYYYPLECTDPARAAVDPRHCAVAYPFQLSRTILYDAPNLSPNDAQARYERVQMPLLVVVGGS